MSEETIVYNREELNRQRAEAFDALILAAENASLAPAAVVPYDANDQRCAGWSGTEWGNKDFSPNGPNFPIDVGSLTQKVLADEMLNLIPSEWNLGISQEGKLWATSWGEADLVDKRKRLAELKGTLPPQPVVDLNPGKQSDSDALATLSDRLTRGEFRVMSDDATSKSLLHRRSTNFAKRPRTIICG